VCPCFYIVSKFWERHVNERWSGLSAHPFREPRSLAVTIQHEWRLASCPVIASCSLAFLSVRREEWLRQQNAFRQSRATPAFSSRRWLPSSYSFVSCSASSIRLVLPVSPLRASSTSFVTVREVRSMDVGSCLELMPLIADPLAAALLIRIAPRTWWEHEAYPFVLRSLLYSYH